MESGEQHHHYWPGEDTIPLTPQALRYGFAFKVYCTHSVWGNTVTWTPQKKHKEVHSETRIYDLLHACYAGLQRKLATEEDFIFFSFPHWFWPRTRPDAKKQDKITLGARLLLDPETEEPWLLIFDPQFDGVEVLKHGEPKENSHAVDGTADQLHRDGS